MLQINYACNIYVESNSRQKIKNINRCIVVIE